MNKQKLERIKHVLKYEQRILNDRIQTLIQENAGLEKINSKINGNQKQQHQTLNPAQSISFAIDNAQSQIQFVNQLESVHQQLLSLRKQQQTVVDQAQLDLVEQQARVKAIESLVKKLNHQIQQEQIYFENNELYDNIVTKALEPNS